MTTTLTSERVQRPSRQKLVLLGINYMENECSVACRNTCLIYSVFDWIIFKKLYSVMSNCLISNRIKVYNSSLAARDDHTRETKKLKNTD